MKILKLLMSLGLLNSNLMQLANASILTDRLNFISGHDFSSSNSNGCGLHLEADVESTPPKLIYTWKLVGHYNIHDYCRVEGVARVVNCSDDFYCGPIFLLPDGNIFKEDTKYFKR